jgi:hypothetical protein
VVDVTPISSGDVFAVWTGATGYNLVILLHDSAGAAVDAAFSFAVYQRQAAAGPGSAHEAS